MSALSAVLLIFSFQFSLLLFHICRQAAKRRTGLPNIKHWTLLKTLEARFFYTERRAQGNDLEIILAETGHPVVGLSLLVTSGIIW